MFSQTLEKQFIKLIGQKFDIPYFSSVFLSRVTTIEMSGNLDEGRLLLIAISNDVDRKFDASLTNFVGILSVPDAFLVLGDFRNKFMSLEATCIAEGKVLLELECLFTDMLFLILIMLE